MKYEKLYNRLKKEYSDEEIVESMLIPADLTEEERDNLSVEMKEIRLNSLRQMSKEDKILSDIMRLRFEIENYLKTPNFSFDKTFGKCLSEYVIIVKRSRKEISEDLSIHYTKLSRIVNDKEEPNVELTYRLAKHSGNLIKAELWWRLIIKKQEFILLEDFETRRKEEAKVKNYLIAS